MLLVTFSVLMQLTFDLLSIQDRYRLASCLVTNWDKYAWNSRHRLLHSFLKIHYAVAIKISKPVRRERVLSSEHHELHNVNWFWERSLRWKYCRSVIQTDLENGHWRSKCSTVSEFVPQRAQLSYLWNIPTTSRMNWTQAQPNLELTRIITNKLPYSYLRMHPSIQKIMNITYWVRF